MIHTVQYNRVRIETLMKTKNYNCVIQDELSAYIMPMNAQVDFACDFVRREPELRKGYNALGFGQGALLLYASFNVERFDRC